MARGGEEAAGHKETNSGDKHRYKIYEQGSLPHGSLCHMNTTHDTISSAVQYEAIKAGTGQYVWTNENKWLLLRKLSI